MLSYINILKIKKIIGQCIKDYRLARSERMRNMRHRGTHANQILVVLFCFHFAQTSPVSFSAHFMCQTRTLRPGPDASLLLWLS